MTKIIINCDGGARGNPGPAAIGVVVRDEKKVLEIYKEKIGATTNNVAEYHALIKALELARKYSKDEVVVIMDSELVIKQMSGEYKVRSEHLLPLFNKVKSLEKIYNKVTYEHVFRTDHHQTMADKLVNDALDKELNPADVF